jgi:FtsP/CotA-like multicopper oxidase with cupredoxin domain
MSFRSRGCSLLVFAMGVSWSALATPIPGDAPLVIRPTVTTATGDTGGKIFGRVPDPQKTRHYYVAAESELWDFAPAGRDEVCGLPMPPTVLRNRKGGKVRYVQYTDATFTAKVIANPSLGILGPVLRGLVGETLAVTFFNRTSEPLSMHPHGVKYDKDSEGAYHSLSPGRGAAVGPGATFTYVWQLDESSGPLPDEPSSKGWLYHSHVSGDAEANLGLIGAIIVTDPKRARPDGTPRDVDREFATLFMIFNESGLDEAAIEAAEYAGLPGLASETPAPSWGEIQQQLEQGFRYAINGYIFGNLPALQMNEGERTRWYLFALGSENDLHTAHWHGLRAIEDGRRRTDVIELLPASMKVADIVADNPGTWLFHCHVAEHMQEGMFSRLIVHPRDVVGVERTPAQAFLGYPPAAQSLRIDRAEAVLNLATAPARAQLIIEGAVTVYEGFAVFNEPIRLQIGERTAEFQPNQQGVAKDLRTMFRVKNCNEFGVVHGGLLEFEIALSGADWIADATKPGAPTEVAVTLEIARARHAATAKIIRRMQKPQ